MPQFVDMTSSFNYWSKLHVNNITGSGVMTIFVGKELTRSSIFGNTPVCVLSNIWRLGQVRDTKLATNVCNKKLLNAAKCQGYSFYRFWVIKGKPVTSSNQKRVNDNVLPVELEVQR